MRAGAAQGSGHAPPGAAAGESAVVLPPPGVGNGVDVSSAGVVLPVVAAAAAAYRPRPPCYELYRCCLESAGLPRRLGSEPGSSLVSFSAPLRAWQTSAGVIHFHLGHSWDYFADLPLA